MWIQAEQAAGKLGAGGQNWRAGTAEMCVAFLKEEKPECSVLLWNSGKHKDKQQNSPEHCKAAHWEAVAISIFLRQIVANLV